MFPMLISPIFAHLGFYKTQGKLSKKHSDLRKAKTLPKRLTKIKKLGFKCGICKKDFTLAKSLNNHSSSLHPKLNLVCKEPMCDFKTKFIQELKDHTKDMHKRNVCKDCNTITVGTAHKTNHEKITHGIGGESEHTHPITQPPVINKKGWVQPKNMVETTSNTKQTGNNKKDTEGLSHCQKENGPNY